jgi:hypothetical protein
MTTSNETPGKDSARGDGGDLDLDEVRRPWWKQALFFGGSVAAGSLAFIAFGWAYGLMGGT